jgi:4-amino-4-deoxy-L-arabinose transferase-like glycosyltransferase
LLPFALLGMIALAWQKKIRFPLELDNQQRSLILWGVWFLTVGIFFSVASFFHEYYLAVMAPAVAALFGIGTVVMWRDYRKGGWKGWLLPISIAVTIATQIYILRSYSEWSAWLTPTLLVVGGLSVLMLVVAKVVPQARMNAFAQRYVIGALCASALVLLLVPTTWAAIPVLNGYNSQLPVAGPNSGGIGGFARNGNMPGAFNGNGMPGGGYDDGRRDGYDGNQFPGGGYDGGNTASNQPGGTNGGQMGDMGGQTSSAMIKYLEEHQGSAKYLVAVPNSQAGSEIILQTNKPVMALGGFSGSDPILTTDELAAMVKDGTVHYFLLGGGGGMGGSSSVTSWVQSNCTAVSASEWGGTSSSSSSSSGLYYCAGK